MSAEDRIAPRFWAEHDGFRVGAGATACLTMVVFLWAVINLPVRGAVSSVQLPGVKNPSMAQAAAHETATAVAAAAPAQVLAASPTAIPTVAPTAVPTVAPTAVPAAVAKLAVSPSSASSSPAVDHKGSTYVVQSGDTLFSIARRYGVPVQSLASTNNLSDSGLVKVGEQLKVP